MDSEWRAIPSLPGFSASSTGLIRNDRTGVIRKWSAGRTGYRSIGFGPRRAKICRTVHSLVAEAFHGPKPAGLVVRHIDGTRTNNCADNLCYGTAVDNAADRLRHGNTMRGHRNGNAKLKAGDAERIIALYEARSADQYGLARMFGISQAQVNNIVLRKQHAYREPTNAQA